MSLSDSTYGPHVLVCVRARGAFPKKKKKVIKQIPSLQTTHYMYLPGYSAHILTYAYVFGYFPYVDTGV